MRPDPGGALHLGRDQERVPMRARVRVDATLWMAGALLIFTATFARAAGLELAWNHCYGQAGSVETRTSACTVNTGSQTMIASFRPPAGVARLEGIEVYINYQTSGGGLGCWWNFAAGELRNAQLTPLPVSPTDVNGNPLVLCDNHYFLDHGATGGGWMTVAGVDRGHLRGVVTIPAGTGLPVLEQAQQYGVGFRISNGSTVPTASCPGCLKSACIVLPLIRLYQPGLPDVILNSPHPGSDNEITWQTSQLDACGSLPNPPPPPVPVLQGTWGAIKSIYR